TSATPQWRRTWVKPPVEAPASRADRPVSSAGARSKASRAPRSLWALRATQGSGSVTVSSSVSATSWAALVTVRPLTPTRPAAISRAAREREPSRFRSTSARSSLLTRSPPARRGRRAGPRGARGVRRPGRARPRPGGTASSRRARPRRWRPVSGLGSRSYLLLGDRARQLGQDRLGVGLAGVDGRPGPAESGFDLGAAAVVAVDEGFEAAQVRQDEGRSAFGCGAQGVVDVVDSG